MDILSLLSFDNIAVAAIVVGLLRELQLRILKRRSPSAP